MISLSMWSSLRFTAPLVLLRHQYTRNCAECVNYSAGHCRIGDTTCGEAVPLRVEVIESRGRVARPKRDTGGRGLRPRAGPDRLGRPASFSGNDGGVRTVLRAEETPRATILVDRPGSGGRVSEFTAEPGHRGRRLCFRRLRSRDRHDRALGADPAHGAPGSTVAPLSVDMRDRFVLARDPVASGVSVLQPPTCSRHSCSSDVHYTHRGIYRGQSTPVASRRQEWVGGSRSEPHRYRPPS